MINLSPYSAGAPTLVFCPAILGNLACQINEPPFLSNFIIISF